MKTLNLFWGSTSKMLLTGALAASVIFSACNKNDDEELILEGEVKVKVVNAAPNSAPQDFYLNDTKVTSNAVAYNQATGYMTSNAGYGVKAEFKSENSATVNFTGRLDLLPNENYTFFYTTQADGSGAASAAFRDDQNPSQSRAKVRFVNLAIGLPGANFLVNGGASLASNVPFGSSSTYFEIDPGTLNLQTSLAGSSSAAIPVGQFALQAGKIYTIYTSGSLTTLVEAHLITHN